MTGLVDSHCHLDAEAFHQDIDDVIRRAEESGVQRILTVGITLATSEAAVVLANRYEGIAAVVGIQPNYAHEAAPSDWDAIQELARHPQVAAVGETGLDKYWDHAPLDIQTDYFHRHIQLSRRISKPFVVHCREAEPEVVSVLAEHATDGPLSGVMHSFCGDTATAERCVEMGMHISFAGMLTFRKNTELRDVAGTLPLDRLLVETDAPYLAPHPNRGKRNEPAWVRLTCEVLATAHNITPDEMAEITTRNATALFSLDTILPSPPPRGRGPG
jgi:TatD DNase family protein